MTPYQHHNRLKFRDSLIAAFRRAKPLLALEDIAEAIEENTERELVAIQNLTRALAKAEEERRKSIEEAEDESEEFDEEDDADNETERSN